MDHKIIDSLMAELNVKITPNLNNFEIQHNIIIDNFYGDSGLILPYFTILVRIWNDRLTDNTLYVIVSSTGLKIISYKK